jgi:hypothetical protein
VCLTPYFSEEELESFLARNTGSEPGGVMRIRPANDPAAAPERTKWGLVRVAEPFEKTNGESYQIS